MNKWLAGFLSLMGAAIILFVITGFFLDNTYKIQRDITIEASQARVHQLVSDLEEWPKWEPWTDGDPTIRITRGDQTTGKGASQSWTGDSGQGQLIFTQVDPSSGIQYNILFEGGKWTSSARINHSSPNTNNTQVSWTMEGEITAPIMGGYIALLMDGMAGPMLELGLTKLKQAAESE